MVRPAILEMRRGTAAAASQGVDGPSLIPKPARIGDLGCRPTKDHRIEVGNLVDVPERFEQERERLSAASTAAIDYDVGSALEKLCLRARLGAEVNPR